MAKGSYERLLEFIEESTFRVVEADGSTGYYKKGFTRSIPLHNKSEVHTQPLSRTQIHANIPAAETLLFSKLKIKPVKKPSLLGASLVGAATSSVLYSLFDNFSYLATQDGYRTVAAYWNPDGSAANLPSSAPVSPKVKPVAVPKAPVVPSIAKHLQEVQDAINKNLEIYNKNSKLLKDVYDSHHLEKINYNDSLGGAVNKSPFLAGQVNIKQSVDDMTHRLGDVVMVIDESNKIIGSKMTEVVSVLTLMAKHSEIKTQASTLSYANDLGDSDFFYAFIPTPDYWHSVDIAGYQQFLKDTNGNPFGSPYNGFSDIYAPREVDLIDSMQGKNTRRQIRVAIEKFRQQNVPSSVRARLVSASVGANAQNINLQNAQQKYYEGAPAKQDALNQNVANVNTTLKDVASSNAKVAESSGKVAVATQGATEQLAKVANSTQAVADSNKKVGDGLESIVPKMERIASAQDSAKIVSDYMGVPSDIKDLDGVVISRGVSPMEVKASDHATHARKNTDENSMEYPDDLFASLMDVIPNLSYIGQSDVYNPDHVQPAENPFYKGGGK